MTTLSSLITNNRINKALGGKAPTLIETKEPSLTQPTRKTKALKSEQSREQIISGQELLNYTRSFLVTRRPYIDIFHVTHKSTLSAYTWCSSHITNDDITPALSSIVSVSTCEREGRETQIGGTEDCLTRS